MGRRRGNSLADGLQAFGATYGIAKGMIDQSGSADAYKENSAVTESVSGDAAMQNFQDNYVPQEGGPATASEYLLQNPDVLKSMSPDRAASFSMGGAEYSKAPTDSQKMAAGLRGSQKYYAASGQADKAADMGLQASRARVSELAVNEGERSEKKAVSNEQELQKFHSVMQSFQNPETAAKYIIDAYSKNLGAYGQGEHKDQSIQFEPTPDGGGKAWTVDASGKAASAPQVFSKDQIIREAQSNYWRNTDPAGYAKAAEAQAARAAEREQANADKNAQIDRKGANDLKIAQMNIEGRKEVAGVRASAGLAGRAKTPLTTAEMKNYDFYVSKGKTPEEAMSLVTSKKLNTSGWSETTKPNQFTGEPETTRKVSGAGLERQAPASAAQTANQIKANMKAGKITRETAIAQLQAIGYK